MSRGVFKAGRLAVAVFLWLILAAGGLREGLQWALQRSMTRLLGVEAPHAQVHLLGLWAESSLGEGTIGEVPVRWRGARVNLVGPASLDSLELGPAIAPILKVEDLRLDHLWPLVAGRAAEVAVSPLRPEWKRLASPSAAGKWSLKLPLRISTPSLLVATPLGRWEGPAAIEGEGLGGRGRWSGELRRDGAALDVSGRWFSGGVEAELTDQGSGDDQTHGLIAWSNQGLRLSLDFRKGEEQWSADAAGGGRSPVRVSVVYTRPGRASQFLAFSLNLADRQPGGWPLVHDLVGRIPLPEIGLGALGILKEGSLSADPQDVRKAGETCLALLVRGRVSSPDGSYMLKGALQVRERASGGAEASLEGSAAGVPTPRLDSAPVSVSWGLWARRDQGGVSQIEANLRSDRTAATVQARSSGNGWSWEGTVRDTAGWLEARGAWSGGRWRGEGHGELYKDVGAGLGWPLPSGPLRGKISAEGGASGVTSGLLQAQGNGSWQISINQGDWTAEVRNGQVSGPQTSLHGLDLSAHGRGFPSLIPGHALVLEAKVLACTISGNDLKNLETRMQVRDGALSARLSGDLAFLDGRAQAVVRREPGGKGRWTLDSGHVDLVGGNVVFNGVKGQWSGEDDEEARWTSDGARIYGEPLASVKGTAHLDLDHGAVGLSAEVAHWGGMVDAGVTLGRGAAPDLLIKVLGIQASVVPPYIHQWIALPLGIASGTASGSVMIPLNSPTEGLHFDATLRDADVELPDKRRTLPKVSGTLTGLLQGNTFTMAQTNMSMIGGKIPLAFALVSEGGSTSAEFSTPSVSAPVLQEALLDFLPEYLGYGTLEGEAGLAGTLRVKGGDETIEGNIALSDFSFVSEDRVFRLKGVNGTLPLLLHLSGEEPALEGFAIPSRSSQGPSFDALAGAPIDARAVTVDRCRYSVFYAEKLRLYAGTSDGSLWARLADGTIWDGGLRGQLRLILGSDGVRYAGQMLLSETSLRAFCEQSGALRGFISGRFNGSLTFGGDNVGLGQLKALADLWVDPEAPEPRLISRDFLVKMGGERIRHLLHSTTIEYDKAGLRFGLTGGILTVYELDLSHQANPVKALMMKDVSFDVRIPQRNSIGLQQLLSHIKALEASGAVSSPPGRKGRGK